MDMLAALRLQIEWGADEALDEAPVDRFAAPAPLTPIRPVIPAAPQAGPRAGPVARAQAAAASAHTLEALYRTIATFRDCPLAATATNMALADGNPAAGLVLVGEAPGAEEDLQGRPFVGPAGQLLDRMLASIGLTREHALLVNLVPWRPPGGRAPTDTEVQTCIPFLWRHLTLLRPNLIVTLGTLPARALTGRDDALRRMRGKWAGVTIPNLPQPVSMLVTLHPSYVLRTPAAKKTAWTDFIALRRRLDSY